mmetsp:Transcript_9358/g.19889  ORF Transcript_9358/g.19889 Transcript_9358/m.19889 type:complete len:398 (+) Transcript_9358:136-1329(+)
MERIESRTNAFNGGTHNPSSVKAIRSGTRSRCRPTAKQIRRICLAFISLSMIMVPYTMVDLHSNNPIERALETKMHEIHKERAAIISLITSEDISNLCNAMSRLDALPDVHMKDASLADVLVFHEPNDLSTESMNRLSNCTTDRLVRFPVVDFAFPPGFDPRKEESRFQKRSKWGYSHMIRFFISGLWEHPAIVEDYDVVMRLDSDACWNQIPVDDPERRMYPYLPPKYVYQRNMQTQDGRMYCEGLYNFTVNYISKHSTDVRNPELWRKFEKRWLEEELCQGFYNNFEITRVKFMRQLAVRQWHEAVADGEPYGVFRHRWGDAVVRYLTMALFSSPRTILYHNNTPYYQHPCYRGIVKTFPSIVDGQRTLLRPRMPEQMTVEEAKKYGIHVKKGSF